MSYMQVILHLAFLLSAGVPTLISGEYENDNKPILKFSFNETTIKYATTFLIHTKERPEGTVLDPREKSPFMKRNTSTKIIVHGHIRAENEIQSIVQEYLNAAQENNIITFSWKFVYRMSDLASARAMKYIGNSVLPKAITQIGCKYVLQPKHIHLIGYNLGAHLVGITAANLDISIGRVTGLDPPRNCFEIPCHGMTFAGLTKTDADFVDVLHTSAHLQGYSIPTGTIDVFANGGSFQPACELQIDLNCNSIMSLKYFAESIRPDAQFLALQCPSYTKFLKQECQGFNTILWSGTSDLESDTLPGTFYFETQATSPYSKGMTGITSE